MCSRIINIHVYSSKQLLQLHYSLCTLNQGATKIWQQCTCGEYFVCNVSHVQWQRSVKNVELLDAPDSSLHMHSSSCHLSRTCNSTSAHLLFPCDPKRWDIEFNTDGLHFASCIMHFEPLVYHHRITHFQHVQHSSLLNNGTIAYTPSNSSDTNVM